MFTYFYKQQLADSTKYVSLTVWKHLPGRYSVAKKCLYFDRNVYKDSTQPTGKTKCDEKFCVKER